MSTVFHSGGPLLRYTFRVSFSTTETLEEKTPSMISSHHCYAGACAAAAAASIRGMGHKDGISEMLVGLLGSATMKSANCQQGRISMATEYFTFHLSLLALSAAQQGRLVWFELVLLGPGAV